MFLYGFIILKQSLFLHRVSVRENAQKGTSLLKMAASSIVDDLSNSQYSIVDGDPDGAFQILR